MVGKPAKMTANRRSPEGVDDHLWDLAAMAEPDYALAISYVTDEKRAPAVVLMAFTAEVRTIPARVTEPMLGAIRLQWWRDALTEAFGDSPARAHPLVQAFEKNASSLLPLRARLEAMIDGTAMFFEPEERVGLLAAMGSAAVHDGGLATMFTTLMVPDTGVEDIATLGALYGVARVSTRPILPGSGAVEVPENRIRRQLDGAAPKLQSSLKAAWKAATPFAQELAPVFAALSTAPAYARGRAPNGFTRQASQFLTVLRGK